MARIGILYIRCEDKTLGAHVSHSIEVYVRSAGLYYGSTVGGYVKLISDDTAGVYNGNPGPTNRFDSWMAIMVGICTADIQNSMTGCVQKVENYREKSL